MNKKKRKINRREYFRRVNTWNDHTAWHIYTAAMELEQPFSLNELQNAIYQKVGIHPKTTRILQEAHEFYEKYDIAIINRRDPGVNAFTANQDIELGKDSYRTIIRPPQGRRGRPRKKYTQSSTDAKRYIRNYQRLARAPEKFLAPIFQSVEQASAEEISAELREFTEGVFFRPPTIRKLLDKYVREGRGPPYLRKVCDGVYRRARNTSYVEYPQGESGSMDLDLF